MVFYRLGPIANGNDFVFLGRDQAGMRSQREHQRDEFYHHGVLSIEL
jgi:hypothetical protein